MITYACMELQKFHYYYHEHHQREGSVSCGKKLTDYTIHKDALSFQKCSVTALQ